MIKYRGHNYREALTPQQKQLKRQYRLEQQMKGDGIPSFEEVWEYHKDRAASKGSVEDYAADYTRVEADEYDTLEWLQQQGAKVPKEPRYDADDHAAWQEQVDALVEEHQETVSQYLSEQKALEYLKDRTEQLYDDAVHRLEYELDGEECWRTVSLPTNIDPAQHDGLGVYWAYDEYAAEAHWGSSYKGDTQQVTYHAKIDLQYVDKDGTIYANTDESLGEEEKEVRFHSGAPIYVYAVTVHEHGKHRRGDDEVLDINDWRTT